MHRIILLLLAILFLVSANIVAADQDAQKFIGTWKLHEILNTDGSANLMFGKKPIGYIIYTKEGLMSAHLMRNQRKTFHSDAITDTTCDEAKTLLTDYYGYAGSYEIDTQHKMVIHHPQIHFLPNSVSKTIVRTYRFIGNDQLYLTTVAANPNLILVWHRVK